MAGSAEQALQDLSGRLYAHAESHYEDGGWDVIVECFSLDDIAACLKEDGCVTLDDAIRSFSTSVSVWADRQADARNSAF